MSIALVLSVYGVRIFQKWKIFRTDQLRDLIDRQYVGDPKISGGRVREEVSRLRASVLHENKIGTSVAQAPLPYLSFCSS